MAEHDHGTHESAPGLSFWQSRTGITLIVFLVIAAILLGYEHRVHIFASKPGSFLFLFAWIGLYFFMHLGHGGHGGDGGHSGNTRPSEPQVNTSSEPIKNDGDKP